MTENNEVQKWITSLNRCIKQKDLKNEKHKEVKKSVLLPQDGDSDFLYVPKSLFIYQYRNLHDYLKLGFMAFMCFHIISFIESVLTSLVMIIWF